MMLETLLAHDSCSHIDNEVLEMSGAEVIIIQRSYDTIRGDTCRFGLQVISEWLTGRSIPDASKGDSVACNALPQCNTVRQWWSPAIEKSEKGDGGFPRWVSNPHSRLPGTDHWRIGSGL